MPISRPGAEKTDVRKKRIRLLVYLPSSQVIARVSTPPVRWSNVALIQG